MICWVIAAVIAVVLVACAGLLLFILSSIGAPRW